MKVLSFCVVAKIWIFGKLEYMPATKKLKISQKIIKYLDLSKIKYEIVNHKTVYTAYDKAATLRVKPNVTGKTLILKADSNLIMVLAPGNKNLDLVKLKKLTKVKKLGFLSEKVLKNKFSAQGGYASGVKGIKLGAIPPFGDLWKLPLFVDRGLLREKSIFISSGIYEASFKVNPKIFENMIPAKRVPGNFPKGKILGAVLGSFSKPKKKCFIIA